MSDQNTLKLSEIYVFIHPRHICLCRITRLSMTLRVKPWQQRHIVIKSF